MACWTPVLIVIGAVLIILTLLRWQEQLIDALRQRNWGRTVLLVLFPPAAWFFRSRVSMGRATPVPPHEPVRGFGLTEKPPAMPETADHSTGGFPIKPTSQMMPNRPPRPPADPEKVAKLKEKMRQQGMIPPDEGP